MRTRRNPHSDQTPHHTPPVREKSGRMGLLDSLRKHRSQPMEVDEPTPTPTPPPPSPQQDPELPEQDQEEADEALMAKAMETAAA